MRTSALALALFLLPLAAPAYGAEVQVHTADGHVIASTSVAAPIELAQVLLASPERIAEVDGRGAEVTSRPEGACVVAEVVASSGFSEIEYSSRSCPVEGGFEGTLIASEQLRDLKARWTLVEADGQLQIEYDLYVVPRIKVPQKLVATLSRRAVRRLVEAIGEELEREAGGAAP